MTTSAKASKLVKRLIEGEGDGELNGKVERRDALVTALTGMNQDQAIAVANWINGDGYFGSVEAKNLIDKIRGHQA